MNNLIESRRSIKKYKSEMPKNEDIEAIVNAGLYAPSAMNQQKAKVIVITNKELRDQVSKLNAQILGKEGIDPFYNAPVIMMVVAPRDWPTARHDGALVIGNMLLKAHELGLGACWIHRADQEICSSLGKEILQLAGLKDEYEGIGHMALGYIDCEYPAPAPRLDGRVSYID